MGVAKFESSTAVGQVVGYLAHVLHAAGYGDVDVTDPNGIRGQCNGFHARRTDLIHRGARHVLAQTSCEGCLSGRCLAQISLEYTPHEDLLN